MAAFESWLSEPPRESPRYRFEAERPGIGRYVRPAFVDDANHAQRHPDTLRIPWDCAAEWDRPNVFHIQRVRVPLGVIGIIYESRPNVTADCRDALPQIG